MKKSIILFTLLLLIKFVAIAQNITLSIENAAITNDGTDDYYEMDVYIETDADYIQGSGQFFLNYNEAAFGSNIFASGGITYERPLTSILGSQTVGVDNYNTFVVNDNITSRVSYLWQQFWSSGAIGADNITSVPVLLVHVKMKMIDVGASTDVCFDDFSHPAFDDQFFTACGPTTFAGADCFNYPGTQILDYQPDCSGAGTTGTCGGGDNIWDGSSWSKGSSPTLTENVFINGNYDTASASIDACTLVVDNNSTLTVSANTYVNVDYAITVELGSTLNILNNGSLVQIDEAVDAINNGSISVERITPLLTDDDFSIMGSPMSAETRDDVYGAAALVRYHDTNLFSPHTQVTADDPDAENFADQEGDNWINHTGAITVGEGYLVKPFANNSGSSGNFTTNYTIGTLNEGVLKFTTIYNNIGTTEENQNASPNILANPYASAIDADSLITNNSVVDAIYYWEHISAPNPTYPGYNNSANYDMGDISMYNLSGGIAAANNGGGAQASNQFIPSGQGFGIKANAVEEVEFNNAMRVKDQNDGYRNNETIDRLYVKVSNETYGLKSSFLVAFTENATNGYDRNYDAKRLATPVSLYSLNSERELGIQGIPVFNEDQIIPLGFSTKVEELQEYNISIGSIEGELLSQATVYLKDNLLNTVTNLSEIDYSFTANVGHQTNRFVIVFSNEILGTNEVSLESISLYPNPAQSILTISSPLAAITSVEVFDLRGRKVSATNSNYQNSYQLDVTKLKSAVYFVKIDTEKGTITKRIIKE